MKKFILNLLLVLGIVLGTSFVKADGITVETMPTTGYSVDVEAETKSSGASLTMTLNHPDINGYSSVKFYLYFVQNENASAPELNAYVDSYGKITSVSFDWSKSIISVHDSKNTAFINSDWYLAKDYEWAYVVLNTKNGEGVYENKITSQPIHVKRPEIPSITERYQLFLFSDEKSSFNSFPYFPYSYSNGTELNPGTKFGNHKLITKIGLVSDNEILSEIRNGKSQGYTNLLTYAKEHTNGKTWEYDDNDKIKLPIDDFDVANGSYYYVYTTYTDSDGLYRNLDGISLVMGKNNSLVTELEWTSTDISDELVDGGKTSDDVSSSPKTGDSFVYVAWAVGLATLGYSVYYFRKGKKEEDSL